MSVEFCPKNQKEWREWLEKHHQNLSSVWLIYYKNASPVKNITWSEAVETALCFGWIDSTKKTIDDKRFKQFFSKRKPYSTWSKINKDAVEKLISQNLMSEAGHESIQIAKANGSWDILNEVEKLIIPKDLESEFLLYPGSKEYFKSHSSSTQKMMLQWIALAKRAETRYKRIQEIAKKSSQNQKPKQFQY